MFIKPLPRSCKILGKILKELRSYCLFAGLLFPIIVEYLVTLQGGTAVDAVEKAVNNMEDNHCMNAGHGAVLNEVGQVECDAMIMNGSTMNSG